MRWSAGAAEFLRLRRGVGLWSAWVELAAAEADRAPLAERERDAR
jgi:hypothetical protein